DTLPFIYANWEAPRRLRAFRKLRSALHADKIFCPGLHRDRGRIRIDANTRQGSGFSRSARRRNSERANRKPWITWKSQRLESLVANKLSRRRLPLPFGSLCVVLLPSRVERVFFPCRDPVGAVSTCPPLGVQS